jgi:hypothetical protein
MASGLSQNLHKRGVKVAGHAESCGARVAATAKSCCETVGRYAGPSAHACANETGLYGVQQDPDLDPNQAPGIVDDTLGVLPLGSGAHKIRGTDEHRRNPTAGCQA